MNGTIWLSVEKKGKKIAVLSYTDKAELTFKGDPMLSFAAEEDKSGVAPRKYELIKEDIEAIREEVDILIVSLHWGVEDSFNVSLYRVNDFRTFTTFSGNSNCSHRFNNI